jgi:type IV secretion system protein VirD4
MNTLVELINAMETREEDESFENAVDMMFKNLENGKVLVDEGGNPVLDEEGEPVMESLPQPDHFALRQYRKYKLAAGVVCSKGHFNQCPLQQADSSLRHELTDARHDGKYLQILHKIH